MNRLLEKDRAIVTPYPGTTRDHIEDSLEIGGIPAILIDTAGLHDSEDPVEKIGIENAKEVLENANLILFVCDISVSFDREDRAILKMLEEKEKIVVFNKTDLVDMRTVDIPNCLEAEMAVAVSALNGDGIETLKNKMARNHFNFDENRETDILVSNIRHKRLVENAKEAVERAVFHYDGGYDLEIVSIEMKEAMKCIDSILGVEIGEDILDAVFSRFCIGK